jgi:DNA-binding response OmpR family regulator
MRNQQKAIAFDVDSQSLATFREAFPNWELEVSNGATVGSLRKDWSPGQADLLVVVVRAEVTSTLGLCRGLRSQLGRAHTPLLALVPPAQQALVRALLEAGAHGCLVLPIHAKDLLTSVARARTGSEPGQHTLGLDRAQREDPWQDNGGEG